MAIHPTAVIDPKAELDSSVEVGAYAVVGPDVRIGAGSKIGHHVVVEGLTTIGEQKRQNVRLNLGISKEEFVRQRQRDDTGKAVPQLLLPSIQANLRNGQFGKEVEGTQFIKLPVNKF